jgi:integrase
MGSCLGVGFVQPFLTAITSGTHTREVNRGTGYDPLKPQRGWRSAWRSLRIETAERAAQGIEDEAARKKAMAPFIGLRFHDLRHTAITKLAESEASDQTIMSIAGHLDRKMLEHYSHIRNAAKRKAVDAIKSYIPGEHTLRADNSATVQ